MMKKITKFLLLSLTTLLLFGNITRAQEECVTVLTQEQVDYMNDTRDERDIIDMSIFDNGITSIPLVAHIVRDSNGNGGLSEDALKLSIDQLNERYAQVGFEFSLCKTNFIDNTNHFNNFEFSFSENSEEYTMAKPNLVTGAVNIFFAPNPLANGRSACGWSSFPAYLSAFGKDWTVMKNDCATNGSTLAHEMGHFFNLYHTHQGRSPSIQVFEEELVDRSNCGKNVGDELCDTPAEPSRNSRGNSGVSGCVSSACAYICNDRDSKNDLYKPNTSNLMSYSRKSCRDFFSPQQIERVQQSYMFDRDYLADDCEKTQENPCKANDREALIALYNATNGAGWTKKWDLNSDHREWYGIGFNNDGCVNELHFRYDNNLTGSLPPEIGNLEYLEKIIISKQNITGTVPPIGNLSKLRILNLSDNELEGEIPEELFKLPSLVLLDLSNNNLSGIISEKIGSLNKLKSLYLNRNQLTGSIPNTLSNLTNLTHLNILYNDLGGCYNQELKKICSLNAQISIKEKFGGGNLLLDAPWKDFCQSGAGTCTNGNNDFTNGDFNDDGTVNHADAIYLGLSYGNTGEACGAEENKNNCPDWDSEVNGVNAKFQDGDGNGVIDEADLKAIEDNYGVATTVGNPVSVVSKDFMFKVKEVENNASRLIFDLYVESISGESISTHGLACSINFGDLIVDEVTVDLNDSALEPTIEFDRYNRATNTLDISMSRTDKVNKNCDTPIASITVLVIEGIDTDEYELNISKINSINATGILSEGVDSNFDSIDGNTKLDISNSAVNYISQNSPNPFSDQSTISYFIPELSDNVSLKVYNLTGHLLQTTIINQTGSGEINISSKDIGAGLYIYTLEIDGIAKDSKRMIIH